MGRSRIIWEDMEKSGKLSVNLEKSGKIQKIWKNLGKIYENLENLQISRDIWKNLDKYGEIGKIWKYFKESGKFSKFPVKHWKSKFPVQHWKLTNGPLKKKKKKWLLRPLAMLAVKKSPAHLDSIWLEELSIYPRMYFKRF